MTSSISSKPKQIAIIGGGIMGVSTLFHLTSHLELPRHSSLTLVETASQLAPGASGKAGGFLARDWHGEATASLAELSYGLHRHLAQERGGDVKWGYREVETLSVEYDDSYHPPPRRSRGGEREERGEVGNVHWIDQDHIVASTRMGGNGTTAQVTPGRLIEYLAQEARRVGGERGMEVNIRLNTSAKALHFDQDDKVTSLMVSSRNGDEEKMPITDVVIAAGPWTGSLMKQLIPSTYLSKSRLLSSASKITGSRAHSIILKTPKPTTNHCLFTQMNFTSPRKGKGHTAAAPEIYTRSDGTVYICGEGDDEPLPPTAEEVTFDPARTSNLIESSAILAPDMLSISTEKNDGGQEAQAQASLVAERACYLPVPPGDLLLGGDPKSGIWLTGGAGCWGITLGPGCGSVLADLILTGESKEADIGRLQG